MCDLASHVTDIWRTESGRSKRFTEPLASSVAVAVRPGDGLAVAGEVTGDSWVRPAHGRWNRAVYATGGSLLHLAQGSGPHWIRMARPAVACDRFALSRAGPR